MAEVFKIVWSHLLHSEGALRTSMFTSETHRVDYEPYQRVLPRPGTYLLAFDTESHARYFLRVCTVEPSFHLELWRAETTRARRCIRVCNSPQLFKNFWHYFDTDPGYISLMKMNAMSRHYKISAWRYAPEGTVACDDITLKEMLEVEYEYVI